jgi:flagellar hook-associated protein 1 FlgK
LGGLLDYEQQILAPTQHAVSELAGGLASLVNGQLQSGFDANGAPGQPLFAFANGKLTMATTSAQQLAFASRPGEPGNGDNLKAMIALKGSKLQVSEFDAAGHPVKDSMGGTRTKSVVLGDVYSQVVGTLGVQSQQNQAAQTTAQTLRDQAKESWQSTSGVNSDEEAINLMQYSQLYNANLRVVASANELFDSTLEMLH